MRRRVDGSERVETMPHLGLVEGTETSVAPRAYVISAAPVATAAPAQGGPTGGGARRPARQPGVPPGAPGPGGARHGRPVRPPHGNPTARVIASVVDRLRHTASGTSNVERADDQGRALQDRQFRYGAGGVQGTHNSARSRRVETTEQAIPAGSLVIPMDQPLARLAFILFDPRSDDGLMAWNILDPLLGASPPQSSIPCSGRWRRSRSSMRRAEVFAASVLAVVSVAAVWAVPRPMPAALRWPFQSPGLVSFSTCRSAWRLVAWREVARAAPQPEHRRALTSCCCWRRTAHLGLDWGSPTRPGRR